MTDRVCQPGTKFWRPPVEVTLFFKAKKDYIDHEAGEKYDTIKLLMMVQVTVLFHTYEFILFGLSKTETGAKTASRVPKLGYFNGREPKLSSRATLTKPGPAWSVIYCVFLRIPPPLAAYLCTVGQIYTR